MIQHFGLLQVPLSVLVRNLSIMHIHQIFKLNYYKKLQDWWTDDVNGDCISFNFYRNTESSMIFLKRWREDKKKYCQIYQRCSYLEKN